MGTYTHAACKTGFSWLNFDRPAPFIVLSFRSIFIQLLYKFTKIRKNHITIKSKHKSIKY